MPQLTGSLPGRSNRVHPQISSPVNLDQYLTGSRQSTPLPVHIIQIPTSIFVNANAENFRAVVQNLTGQKRAIQDYDEECNARYNRKLKVMTARSKTTRQKRHSGQERVASSAREMGEWRHNGCDAAVTPAWLVSFLERDAADPFSLWESLKQPSLFDIIALDHDNYLHQQSSVIDHNSEIPATPVLWDWPDL